MPVYTMDVILRSDTSAADDPIEFVQGSWTLNGGWSTITYSDDDANGLGDDNPNTETGDASIITHVNGSSTHPLVGSEVFARYVRSDMGDDSDNFADAVFLGEDETNPYVNGWSYAVAAYPGSGWTMNTGDTYQEGNFHPIDHATGSTWSTEGFVGNTTDVTPPCFTTGMEIRTDRGAVAVEDLEVGDMVWTLDQGYQELKFIGRQKMVALGELAPVLFKRGVIGNTKDLVVSQKHRFHVGSLPKALRDQFGDHADTLLQAVQFCDGVNVRLYP
ncbi:MAG: Hint domain-containing protein, partial [Planktomarina sp.]